jgi:peptide/nickel transport system ATP-binding protein
MKEGNIVEEGPRYRIFDDPRHEYTRTLLSAVPALQPKEGGVELHWRLSEERLKSKSAG